MSRITIPPGHIAVLLPHSLAAEAFSLALEIRRKNGKGFDAPDASRLVASDLVLALYDAGAADIK